MPFFPRTYSHSHPALDLLSLFDQSFPTIPAESSTSRRGKRAFSPNFDVHENANNYVLEGEVPGLSNKDNLDIQFTDERTLLVKGRIEQKKTFTSEKKIEAPAEKKSIENTAEKNDESVADDWESVKEPEKEKNESEKPADTEVTTTEPPVKKAKTPEPKPKYWVSERSVGEFARSFSFPEPVNVDAVTAKLEHGIVTVVVPKMEKKGARKISIN